MFIIILFLFLMLMLKQLRRAMLRIETTEEEDVSLLLRSEMLMKD